MRDATRDLQAADIDLVAEPPCCPDGTCGPVFETPLLELAFNRVRDLVRGRGAPDIAEATAAPAIDPVLRTRPTGPAASPHPHKDAPHD